MAIDKQKSQKEANRIKSELVASSKLGLTDSDVTVREDKEDGGYTITILNGRLPSGSEGASPRNISDAIDKDFRDFRAKGWVFTQPQGGSFRVAVIDKNLKESAKFSFRDFLAEGRIEGDGEYKLVYRQNLDGQSISKARRALKSDIRASSVVDKIAVEYIEEIEDKEDEFEMVVTGSEADLIKLAKELEFWYQEYTISKK